MATKRQVPPVPKHISHPTSEIPQLLKGLTAVRTRSLDKFVDSISTFKNLKLLLMLEKAAILLSKTKPDTPRFVQLEILLSEIRGVIVDRMQDYE